MTVRQEGLMERAISPNGDSGQQWDAWEAMFSPRDPDAGLPVPMFDSLSGAIDRTVVEHWKQYDISRLVTEKWSRYGPALVHNVRLVCGTHDSFYLNRAVERFKKATDPLRARIPGEGDARGYIRLIDGATHGSVLRAVHPRWKREMREHLTRSGFPQPGGE